MVPRFGEEISREKEEIINTKNKEDNLNPLIFGSELFDNPTLNFRPNLKLLDSSRNYIF
jgi:hypothetical protein